MAVVDGRQPLQQQSHPSKIRWGELEEDDADYYAYLLPPPVVIGPDENGVKKVIEYKFNDDGEKVKVTTTTRTRKLARARLSKKALERRNWPKFGDAVHEEVGNRLTMISTEEIILERPRAPGTIFSFHSVFLISSSYLFVFLIRLLCACFPLITYEVRLWIFTVYLVDACLSPWTEFLGLGIMLKVF